MEVPVIYVNLNPDLEQFLHETVRDGRNVSEDEALNDAVRLLKEQRPGADAPAHNGRDPSWGLLADEADVLDEIVADAMQQRELRGQRLRTRLEPAFGSKKPLTTCAAH